LQSRDSHSRDLENLAAIILSHARSLDDTNERSLEEFLKFTGAGCASTSAIPKEKKEGKEKGKKKIETGADC